MPTERPATCHGGLVIMTIEQLVIITSANPVKTIGRLVIMESEQLVKMATEQLVIMTKRFSTGVHSRLL